MSRVKQKIAVSLTSDPLLWIEHIALAPVSGSRWLLLEPEKNIVDLTLGNPSQVAGIRWARSDGSFSGVDELSLLRFDDVEGVDDFKIDDYIEEAKEIVATLRGDDAGAEGIAEATTPGGLVGAALRRHGHGGGDGDGAFTGGVDGIPASGAGAADRLRQWGLIGGYGLGDEEGSLDSTLSLKGQWYLAETSGKFLLGQPFALGSVSLSKAHVIGDHALVQLESGEVLFLRQQADASSDRRTLPIIRDGGGKQWREFKDAVDHMDSSDLDDWQIGGPRTTHWVLRHMYRYGGTPMSFFQRWLSEVRLDMNTTGVAELMGWCKFFETAACFDQLNLSNLCAAELGARRIQMICERWKHKLASGVSASGGSDLDDVHLILGTSETRGNLCLCPQLQTWIGEELSKEAVAAKERRKAREERNLAAKPPDKK
eukprot:TRINITY_DN43221_c0_g3_i1.p1 TRINITY_DN43221_c0_g3~~TRINITY_DN43221_c0_g3_i1.p1  ORF type:complete len:428 (+),score=66.73 TRINITY_DN43221_c0_g3_i1:361-1644(+)